MTRTWGARFLPQDAVAILAVVALTAGLHRSLDAGPERWIVALPGLALGHFFLFCNVFRVRTRYELLWTAAFLGNVLAWWAADALLWQNVLAVQTPLTALALGAEVRSAEYHGVRADRWNPALADWISGDGCPGRPPAGASPGR